MSEHQPFHTPQRWQRVPTRQQKIDGSIHFFGSAHKDWLAAQLELRDEEHKGSRLDHLYQVRRLYHRLRAQRSARGKKHLKQREASHASENH